MINSRIPPLANKSHAGMARWFDEMSLRGLLFHPEDSPSDMVDLATGKPMFNDQECAQLDALLKEMFEHFGNDVCDTACPIFMKAIGISHRN